MRRKKIEQKNDQQGIISETRNWLVEGRNLEGKGGGRRRVTMEGWGGDLQVCQSLASPVAIYQGYANPAQKTRGRRLRMISLLLFGDERMNKKDRRDDVRVGITRRA